MRKLKLTALFLLSIPCWGAQVGVFTLYDFHFNQVAFGTAELPAMSDIQVDYGVVGPSVLVSLSSKDAWHVEPGGQIMLSFGFQVSGTAVVATSAQSFGSGDGWTSNSVWHTDWLVAYQGWLYPGDSGSHVLERVDIRLAAAPEPLTWIATAIGFALLLFWRRRCAGHRLRHPV